MVVKFIARVLGLWKPEELPEPCSGRILDVAYDVRPLSRGMVSISMYLPRDRMVIQPTCVRKSEGSARSERNTGWCIDALFSMAAQSIHVGSDGDKLEVIFWGEARRMDNEFIKQAVYFMLHLHCEALGEQFPAAHEMQRLWSKEAESSLDFDGQTVTFEFSSCLVDTDEEAGTLGNLDVMVRTTPSLPLATLRDNLRLGAPGYAGLLDAPASGQIEGGFELCFAPLEELGCPDMDYDARHDWRRETVKSLQEVNVFWGDSREAKLADLRCDRAPENA